MKTLAKKIEKEAEQMYVFDDDGRFFIPVDYNNLKFTIEGCTDKKMLIKPAIREWKDNTETPGVVFLIGSKHCEAFIDVDTFLSLVFTLDGLNLLQMGHGLAAMYFSQTAYRTTLSMNKIEETES